MRPRERNPEDAAGNDTATGNFYHGIAWRVNHSSKITELKTPNANEKSYKKHQ